MPDDFLVQEVRRARNALARKCDCDLEGTIGESMFMEMTPDEDLEQVISPPRPRATVSLTGPNIPSAVVE